jgi:two-component SAPR family response regulator
MDYKKIFERFEKEDGKPRDSGPAFIKTTAKLPTLDSTQKVALNRKGNVLFNAGGAENIENARKIFQATGYSDGLSRVGDVYKKQGRYMDALRMYQIAPNHKKFDELTAQLAAIIQNLLHKEDAPHE